MRASGVAANEASAMIIQEHGDHLILIRQTDHAVLSGYFARESGNENFMAGKSGSSSRVSTPSRFCHTASCPCPPSSTSISTSGESNGL
ncbi:MAG: hypothetical protein DMG49_12250 [Acidobacteria bacterium]|nr:MAG: hypothetical protein DMG49_12250 [Acidobacteriota bacterium]